MTCIPSDARHNGRKSLALCGNWCTARDLAVHAEDATCPDCRSEWARLNDGRTAEDVFGTVEEIRAFGPPVKSIHS